MKRFLASILQRTEPPAFPDIAPARPFVAIGDVHGRADLFAELLRGLREDVPDLPVVSVGDLIDRGPDSAGVLDLADRAGVQCLRGNHETMLLEFIDNPASDGPRWLANGGVQTLESFGVTPPGPDAPVDRLCEARDAFLYAIGSTLVDRIRAMPLIWKTGNVAVVHAGPDPRAPLDPSRAHGILWGHPDFFREPRSDGTWIVHGHYARAQPDVAPGRIGIDTTAYQSGMLTAAVISPGSVRFLSTQPSRES